MTAQLQSRVAFLESQVDLLETELTDLHRLLVECGFPEGIKTLKATVEELLSTEHPTPFDDTESM